MKRILLSILSIVAIFKISAQSIEFEETIHDFGTASELDGFLVYEFKFVNKGTAPLVISKVKPDCGCTTTGWTKSPVKPGESGFVKAVYNTTGRPYPFEKRLVVVSNGDPASVALRIKGVVTPKPLDIRQAYPDSIGELRFKRKDIDFARISSDETSASQTLTVANPQKQPIGVSFENLPPYITAKPVTLKPGEIGTIEFGINGAKRQRYGYVQDKVTIRVGQATGTINVSSVVGKVVAGLTGPDYDAGPQIAALNDVDLGNLKADQAFQKTIEITNNGKDALIINSVTVNDPTIKASVKGTKVKPGKSVTLTLESTGLKYNFKTAKVYLETNDLHDMLWELTVRAKVGR